MGFNILKGQNLPNTQQTPIIVPSDIKIDGKSAEWNNIYQAYNRATELYYTISNDNNNIYLITKTVNPRIIQKILEGSISLTFSTSNSRVDTGNITVSFPLITLSETQNILFNSKKIKLSSKDNLISITKDSLIKATNTILNSYSKDIKLTNVKSFDKTEVISVYNDLGIKTAHQFDVEGNLVCEFCIPLRYIRPSLSSQPNLLYQIKLNGRYNASDHNLKGLSTPGTSFVYDMTNHTATNLNADLDEPTYFWAKYSFQ
jgi:hypothetical protein